MTMKLKDAMNQFLQCEEAIKYSDKNLSTKKQEFDKQLKNYPSHLTVGDAERLYGEWDKINNNDENIKDCEAKMNEAREVIIKYLAPFNGLPVRHEYQSKQLPGSSYKYNFSLNTYGELKHERAD